jgi:hypothetical protein
VSSSTAKGRYRLSGDLPPAYEEDERAQAAVAILTDGVPYGILATAVHDQAKLKHDLRVSCDVIDPEHVIRRVSFGIPTEETPTRETYIQTKPELVLPPSPKTIMFSVDLQTKPEPELKPEALWSTAKGKRRLSGDLPLAYKDERAHTAAAILADSVPSGILAITVT